MPHKTPARAHAPGDSHAGAAELYREALDCNGENPSYWFNLGIAYAKLGRREDAIRAYEKAVTLAPDEARYRAALEAARRPPRQ
jgi:Flp pilus assembly protein TadD